MLNISLLESRPIKIILSILIILEVFFIATKYNINFDAYIKFIMILLALPISFFSVRYLMISQRETQTYEAIPHHLEEGSVEKTNE